MSTRVADAFTIARMRSFVVVLAGCASFAGCVWSSSATTTPVAKPAVIDPDPADALVDLKADELPEGAECETRGTADLPEGHAELVVCQVGSHADSPQQEAEGFIMHDMRADLVLTGKHHVTTTIETWTNGWEWGTGYELVAQLVNHKRGAIVLRTGSSGPSPGSSGVSSTLHVYAIDNTGWHDVLQLTAVDLDVEVDAAHSSVLTVSTCEALPIGTMSSKGGCRGMSDADPGDTTRLTWTGRKVLSEVLPPPVDADDANAP